MSEDCDPLMDVCGTEDFNITAAINEVSPERFAELCDGDRVPQRFFAEEHREREFGERKVVKFCRALPYPLGDGD